MAAVSDLRITGTGGPNFGYDLAIRKTKPEQRSLLDLSCLEVCYCGSEPIHPSVVNRFFQTFAECGLSRNCFVPCYGLAEATLLVTSHIFGVRAWDRPRAGLIVFVLSARASHPDAGGGQP